MAEGLLRFVPPNFSREAAVLVIDSEKYLAGLRKLMPAARILRLTSEDELPAAAKIFDVIIDESCLTFARGIYQRLAGMRLLLKDSGFLLTQFLNVRFVEVLENLRRGGFSAGEERFWAKRDVVRILDDAAFKEIRFLPGEKLIAGKIESWIDFGFENFSEDLATRIWQVKACRNTAEVAALKDLYAEKTRAQLSRLLMRIEFGIDAEENLAALRDLCAREKIFGEYLSDFVAQVVTHKAAAEFILAAVDKNA